MALTSDRKLVTANPSSMRLVGVLLAAGRGTRFDPTGERSKLLEPLARGPQIGVPIALAAWRNLFSALDEVLVVIRPPATPADRRLRELLVKEGAILVDCAGADNGISASLLCGVRAASDADGWLIALADMPAIAPGTIAAVAAALRRGHVSAAPQYRGQRGHPVGFTRPCLDLLRTLRGDEGARSVLLRFPPLLVDVDDPGCLLDIDTPVDARAIDSTNTRYTDQRTSG